MKSPVEKIALRSLNWLGDAVMSMPAVQRLREAKPGAEIVVITRSKLEPLWQLHPDIDRIISLPEASSVWKASSLVRPEKFDCALIFPNSFRSAFEMFWSGVKERVGYATDGRGWMLSRRIPRLPSSIPMKKKSAAEVTRQAAAKSKRDSFSSGAHHQFHYLNLAAALGADPSPCHPRLTVSPAAQSPLLAKWPALAGVGPLFGMNPGADYGPAKCWPAERFVHTACHATRRMGARWVVVGRSSDATTAIVRELKNELGPDAVVDLAGKTTLEELSVVLSLLNVLVTNDSGPMHLAAALDTPVIVPFGSTAPELTGPLLPEKKSILLLGEAGCAPCFRRECPIDFRCMRSIEVPAVLEALKGFTASRR